MMLIGRIDGAKNVEVDLMLAKFAPALHHLVKGALAAAINAIGVVDFAGSVDAQADQKIVFLEERAPFVVKKDAIGLKGVFHCLLWPTVFFDELDGAPEELDFHQRRLAPLPRHGYGGCAVRLQQLTNVGLECGIGHPILLIGIQRLFGQEEAISAIDVASGTARFRQQVKSRRRLSRPAIVRL